MAEPFGRYQLLKRIAGGGMGEVFLARQGGIQGFEKLLVIKTLLPHLNEDTEFVHMFLDEARIAARLAHPNVVSIFDLGEEQGVFYIAMEFVHGEDVKRIWKQSYHSRELIPIPLALRIVSDAAAGLGYAHRLADSKGQPIGLVHRDVSPQNILVTFDGGVKLIDFGVAKAAGRMTKTQTGALKGKYAYMSPEQVDGEEVDQRSDVFALGIVLWEMVTGSRLFRADSDVQTLKAVLRCDVVPPSVQNPNVPPDLDPVILKALTKSRDERYASAEEFRMAIENYLSRSGAEGSAAHLAEFMRKLFHERLEKEGTLGPLADVDPNATGFSPFGGTRSGTRKPTEADSASQSLMRPGVDPGGPAARPPEPRKTSPAVYAAGAVGLLLLGMGSFWGVQHLGSSPAKVTPPPTGSGTTGAAVAAPTTGRYVLGSTPAGARVHVDLEDKGTTPVSLDLPLGKPVQVEVALDGYKPYKAEIRAESGEHKLDYPLEKAGPAAATVRVESEPAGAQVFQEQTLLGTTPFDWNTVADGQAVQLTFKLAGHKPVELQVARGQPVSPVKLQKVRSGTHTEPPKEDPALQIKTGR